MTCEPWYRGEGQGRPSRGQDPRTRQYGVQQLAGSTNQPTRAPFTATWGVRGRNMGRPSTGTTSHSGPESLGDDGPGKHPVFGGRRWGKGAVSGRGARGSLLGEARVPAPGKFSSPPDHRGPAPSLCLGAVGSSAPHPRYGVQGWGPSERDVSHFLPSCCGQVGTPSSRR